MPATVYLITGGARSGKSNYAQHLCETICKEPIYLATSEKKVWDDDFKQRIKLHQDSRGDHWTTIEEPLKPSLHAEKFSGKAILVDCLTLWLTNYMMQEGAFTTAEQEGEDAKAGTDTTAPERALQKCKDEFDTMTKQWDATFIFVTNEIGSGTHAETAMTRMFVDAQGWLNQHVGARADRVVHMVCGIPNTIKEPPQTKAKDDKRNPARIPNDRKRKEAQILDTYLSSRSVTMEAKGYFMMKLDRTKGVIFAEFYSCMVNEKGEVCDLLGKKIKCCGDEGKKQRPEPYKTFEGRTAKELTVEIFDRWPDVNEVVKCLNHAAYIGREAQRAEHCLYSGEHYQQD